jgi:type I restriction enzyme S subunit
MAGDTLPHGWRLTKLGDLGEVNRGRSRHRPRYAEHLYGGPYPFIQTGDIKSSGGRITTYQQTYSEAGLAQSRMWPAGTMCITIAANIAETGILAFPACFPDSVVGFVPDESQCNVRFIEYTFRHLKQQIQREASGTVQDNINLATLERLRFPLPPLPEQRAIAYILGSLDDKIELNRLINKTLETVARAIFKSWFVDFDPVRAKAEGRDPGLDNDLTDLFPDSFEDSEQGKIPKGWNVGPLSAFFKVGIGGAWGDDDASERAPVSIRCLRGIDCHELAEGQIPDAPIRWLSEKQAADRTLTDGTILIEGSGSFCGRSLLWDSSYGSLVGEPVSYSNFCKRLDPLCTASQATVCWLQMRNAYRTGELHAFRTGTAFPNFDIHGMLASLLVVVPSEPVANAFAQFFRLSRRVDLMAQGRTLASLRDTLLPKLISGELRIQNVERVINDPLRQLGDK